MCETRTCLRTITCACLLHVRIHTKFSSPNHRHHHSKHHDHLYVNLNMRYIYTHIPYSHGPTNPGRTWFWCACERGQMYECQWSLLTHNFLTVVSLSEVLKLASADLAWYIYILSWTITSVPEAFLQVGYLRIAAACGFSLTCTERINIILHV